MKLLHTTLAMAMLTMSYGAEAQNIVSEESFSSGETTDEVLERDNQWWTCRADVRDDSGIFFLGMGRTRADAYVMALEACNRQNRSCTITCTPDFN